MGHLLPSLSGNKKLSIKALCISNALTEDINPFSLLMNSLSFLTSNLCVQYVYLKSQVIYCAKDSFFFFFSLLSSSPRLSVGKHTACGSM